MMRAVTALWRQTVRYSHAVVTEIDSYLGGVLLYRNLPIASGTMKFDDTGSLKRTLNATFAARVPGGANLDPAGDPRAPLANYGQRLLVRTGIRYPDGSAELVSLGWVLITEWKRDESNGAIDVQADDLARLVTDDQFTAPSAPPAGATFGSEFARLVAPYLTAVVSPALVDRPVPGTVVWDRDRDQALQLLMAAWPARWYVGDDGKAYAAPPYPAVAQDDPPTWSITDGSEGTITGRGRQAQRGAIPNTVVVDGKAPADAATATPHAVAEWNATTAPGSPIAVDGPYGRVVRFFQSDAIATQGQADSAASAQLIARSAVGRAETVTAAPDPSIDLGDVGQVFTRDGLRFVGRLSTVTFPLTVPDGPMTATVSNVPADTGV